MSGSLGGSITMLG